MCHEGGVSGRQHEGAVAHGVYVMWCMIGFEAKQLFFTVNVDLYCPIPPLEQWVRVSALFDGFSRIVIEPLAVADIR